MVRRADDPEDPRKDQPLVKTRDRKIPLSPGLCKLTHEYITNTRRATEGARRHPFLFIAMGTGAPLSLSAVNAIFAELRNAFNGEFDAITPHVLRHTWNDRFSDMMDTLKVSEAEEERMRSWWQRSFWRTNGRSFSNIAHMGSSSSRSLPRRTG